MPTRRDRGVPHTDVAAPSRPARSPASVSTATVLSTTADADALGGYDAGLLRRAGRATSAGPHDVEQIALARRRRCDRRRDRGSVAETLPL